MSAVLREDDQNAASVLRRDQITIREFFAECAAKFVTARSDFETYNTEHAPRSTDFDAQERGRLALRLRLEAAATAVVGRMLNEGRGDETVDRRSATATLLEDRVTRHGIYGRNCDQDVLEAERHVRAHSPQLVAA